VEIVRPHWSSSSFLTYVGGGSVLVGAIAALAYLAGRYGAAGYASWSLLIFAVLLAIALGLRGSDPIAGGVFAFVTVLAFVLFVAALWRWFGWIGLDTKSGSLFGGFHGGALSLELIAALAAAVVLRVFRFPLIVALVVLFSWVFVTDFISDGGDWSTIVTIGFGLVLLGIGLKVDASERRPYGFWLHFGAGLFVGEGLLQFWHSGDRRWTFVVIVGLAYIAVAAWTGRSSWSVFGYIGLLSAAGHFTVEWWLSGLPFLPRGHGAHHPWAPAIVFAVLGFVLVGLGLGVSRRERRPPRPSGA